MCTNGYERICTNRYARIVRWFLDDASILTHESIKNLENGIQQGCVEGNMNTYKSIRKDTLKTNSVENTRSVWLPSFKTVVRIQFWYTIVVIGKVGKVCKRDDHT